MDMEQAQEIVRWGNNTNRTIKDYGMSYTQEEMVEAFRLCNTPLPWWVQGIQNAIEWLAKVNPISEALGRAAAAAQDKLLEDTLNELHN